MTFPASDREPPQLLHDQIEELTALVAQHPDQIDMPAVQGELGRLRLDLYDQTGDTEALSQGVANLAEAVKDEGRPEWLEWCFWLALGYGALGERYRGRPDYDAAINWLTRLRREVPDDDLVAGELANLLWERYYLVRYGPEEIDRGELIEETGRLVDAVEEARPADPSSVDGRLWQRTYGLAHLARYDLCRDRADLERGIAELAGCVWELTGDARPAYAASQLADAYSDRAILDQDDASLTLSIDTALRGLALPPDGDDLAQELLHHTLAYSSHMRWQAMKLRPDLERAVEEWRTLIALDETADGWEVLQLATALRQRGELDGAVRDVDESVELLGTLAFAATEPALEFSRLAELGRALTVRGTAAKDRTALSRADDALTEALRYPSDDDDALLVQLDRLTACDEALTQDARIPHTELLPSAARMRELLDEGNAALDRHTGADDQIRCVVAGSLALRELSVMPHAAQALDTARMRELLALADRLTDRSAEWDTLIALVGAHVTFMTDAFRPGTDLTYGVDEFAATNRVLGAETRRVAAFAAQLRAGFAGDLRGYRSGLRAMAREADEGPGADPEAAAMVVMLDAFGLMRELDMAGVLQRMRQAHDLLSQAPGTAYTMQVLRPMMLFVEWMARAASGGLVAGESPPVGGTGIAGMDPSFRALLEWMAAVTALTRALVQNDLPEIRDIAYRIDRIGEDPVLPDRILLSVATASGQAWLEAARRDPTDHPAATRAQERFTTAAQLAGDPSFPLWSNILMGQAEAMRLAGTQSPHTTHELGLAALAAHARKVMLQAGAEEALAVAADAARHASSLVDWCLADRAYDTLVTALDAGRGLALLAATNSRGVETGLIRAGRADLAAEWRATAGQGRDELDGQPLAGLVSLAADGAIPDTLRTQVLAVLAAAEPAAGAPVTVAEVRSGLSAAGADALVYLVPGTDDRPGLIVTVPASGQVRVSMSDDLRVDESTPVGGYAASALRTRDLAAADSDGAATPASSFNTRLDDVGAWAWRVAIAGIVDHATEWRLDRPASLVLVPVGELALVPWHAAYRQGDDGRRNAVQDLVFSYSPSARMFCSATHLPPAPIRSALVVGNPSGDLAFAGIEARAVFEAFYPYGTYLGNAAAAGPGTRAQVLDWIRAGASGASMLHLACHGRVEPDRPAGAALLLADGPLAALDIVEATRLGALVVHQVFLAACTTSDVGRAYDEAFSLASVFLAAGARTVFGSMWAVPDAETSLLMFMVHHYLVAEGRRPADSLHAAQLWMLDPARKAPPSMPPELAAHSRRMGAADPVAWAAFTHLGR